LKAASVLAAMGLCSQSASAQYLGVTLGFNYGATNELTGPYAAGFNTPLFNPVATSPNSTWNEWAAQLKQSGVDFVCPNLRGSSPKTELSPVNMAPLIPALNAQGNVTKVAIFDDNGASWVAQWNQAHGNGFDGTPGVNMADPALWTYIYDKNYKLFYQTVPDANRFKINGRPVIIIWSANLGILLNQQGNYSKAMTYVRQKCQADFGFNPYIIVPIQAIEHDTTCAAVADAAHDWFGSTGHTLTTVKGVKIGGLCPQFKTPADPRFIDPNHGITLKNGLAGTVGAGALLTLCEGFTDWPEEAALLRVRNLAPDGTALGYNQTYYDYPNQRINLLRRYSRSPFPANLRYEAEGCDSFGSAAGGNGKVNFYRNGNMAVATNTDGYAGWHVGWMAPGEWLEWKDVPLNGTPQFQVRIATPNPGRLAHLVIDGVVKASKTLPNTGGWNTWTTFNFGSYGTFNQSYHTVRIVFDNGGVDFNWWSR
jgi:Domain of unknown function (DUF5010)/DUF5010 C-terminal domain